MQATIRQLKNQLSKYLRQVQQGEEVTVTSHGKPVARLTGLEESQATGPGNLRERLASLSWVRVGRGGKPRGFEEGIRLRGEGPSATDLVLEDRE